MSMNNDVLLYATEETLQTFSEDVGALWCNSIPTLDRIPNSVTFFRDFVSQSRPCIIRNALLTKGSDIDHEVPLQISLDELVEQSPGEMRITVDVTPDGHGDCVRSVINTKTSSPIAETCSNNGSDSTAKAISITKANEIQKVFVTPEEKKMTLKEFRERLRAGRKSKEEGQQFRRDDLGRRVLMMIDDEHDAHSSTPTSSLPRHEVLYYSRQNDCLREELSQLFELSLFPSTLEFAEEAFGTGPPDAINLWIGDERVVSAMHKDHYENMFYVLSGEKVFTLCPPADAPFLYEKEYPSGQFVRRPCSDTDDDWIVKQNYVTEKDESGISRKQPAKVQWIENDIVHPLHDQFPLARHAHPIEVRVGAGELLYLPSLWFHRVTQSCETVGINYWYDMKFDSPLWCYFHLLQQMNTNAARIT